VNPAPDVCTVSNEETMVAALMVDGAERESILGWDIRPQIREVLIPGKRRLRRVSKDDSGRHSR
jgi:hypothetical protein